MADIVEVSVEVHHETEKAWFVSDDGERDNAVWIPKSQIEGQKKLGPALYEFSLPEWLALDKGLI